MRIITIDEVFPVEAWVMWNMFTDISHYKKYVQFVKFSKVEKGMKPGGMWYDISTILWLPLRYDHWVTKFIPEKEMEYVVYPATGGKIVQSFTFHKKGSETQITGFVTVDLKWKLIDFLMGSIVEERMRIMIEETIKNVKKTLKI